MFTLGDRRGPLCQIGGSAVTMRHWTARSSEGPSRSWMVGADVAGRCQIDANPNASSGVSLDVHLTSFQLNGFVKVPTVAACRARCAQLQMGAACGYIQIEVVSLACRMDDFREDDETGQLLACDGGWEGELKEEGRRRREEVAGGEKRSGRAMGGRASRKEGEGAAMTLARRRKGVVGKERVSERERERERESG